VAAAAADIVAVGQGIVTGQTGWIGNIIVRPDARRRGLGSRMTQEVTASLREHARSSRIGRSPRRMADAYPCLAHTH